MIRVSLDDAQARARETIATTGAWAPSTRRSVSRSRSAAIAAA